MARGQIVCGVVLSAALAFGQAPTTSRANSLNEIARNPASHAQWSTPVGQLASGDTRAVFTAIAVRAADGVTARGVRVALAQGDWTQTLYLDEAATKILQSKVIQMDKSTKHLASDSDIAYSTRIPDEDDGAAPLFFSYELRRSKSPQLHLDGPGLRSLIFFNTRPSDVVVILTRAVKELDSR